MKIKDILFDTATIVISLFCLFPIVTGNGLYRILMVLACLYVILSCFKKIALANKIPLIKIVFVFVISFLISYIVGIKYSINFYINFTILIVFLLVFERYRTVGLKTMKRLIFIILSLICISALQTIIMLISNPAYARILSKNQDLVEVVGLSGGYGLVYACLLTLISVILLIVRKIELKITFRLLLFPLTIVCLILIWKAGFFLALLLLILAIGLMIMGVNKHNIMKNIMFGIVLCAVFFTVKFTMSDVLIRNVSGTKYEVKLRQVLGEETSGLSRSDEFGARKERYLRDFEVMMQYPFIGSWQFLTVGKHSFILDMLAQYGLFFGAYFIYMVFFIPVKIIKTSNGHAFTQSIVFVGVLFVFLLLNSFVISIMPVVFVIFPYTNYLLRLK